MKRTVARQQDYHKKNVQSAKYNHFNFPSNKTVTIESDPSMPKNICNCLST